MASLTPEPPESDWQRFVRQDREEKEEFYKTYVAPKPSQPVSKPSQSDSIDLTGDDDDKLVQSAAQEVFATPPDSPTSHVAFASPDELIPFSPAALQNVKYIGTLQIDDTTYKGEIMNGKPHGKGMTLYKDGSIHQGEYINGLRHGPGVVNLGNSYLKGTWVEDQTEGEFECGDSTGRKQAVLFHKGERVVSD